MKNWIPTDLIIEIVSRLPAKSIGRCRCVSKLWRSIIDRQDFTELFLTRSKARPRLLIGVPEDNEWSFFSLLQPQSHHENSSHVVSAADFQTKFSKGISEYECSYASGLIYFDKMCIPKDDKDTKRVIYNPLTGHYVVLPELRVHIYSYSYLVFDPIDKEYKVLVMSTCNYIAYKEVDHYILTLGDGELRWRKIQCPFTHEPLWERVCINGVLYYLAMRGSSYVIVCFDLRSEEFKFVVVECRRVEKLVDYKGKLCAVNLEFDSLKPCKLSMWVLEDVEKQEWSEHVYSFWVENNTVVQGNMKLSVSGMTAAGDIVLLSTYAASKQFYVFFFNPERNTLQVQSVEIQGVGDSRDVRSYLFFVDYVEDLSVRDAMHFKPSPLQQGRNIVTERPKPIQRRNTSRDLSKSSPSVKNKHHSKYNLLANILYRSVGLAIFVFCFIYFILCSF